MKNGVRWTAWTVVLLVAGLQASLGFAQNPPHLREMPSVDRVMREISVPDPKEAAARLAGAFSQLSDIVAELSNGRVAVGNPTPDEQLVMDAYNNARGAVMTAYWKTPADDEVLRRLDDDPALREELVNRFFSPEMREQYMVLYRELQARRGVLRQQNAAFGGTAAPQAAPAADPFAQLFGASQAAPAQQAVATGPPDASVAQARAANVDTKVFGMQLGEPISLPDCGLWGMVAPAANCRMDQLAGMLSVVTEIAGLSADSEVVMIKLASDSCPQWMPDCTAAASVINGRLAGVVVQPPGPQVKEAVAKELMAKYGRPSLAHQRTITPLEAGSAFQVVDLEWNFPGLHVEYKVVDETVHVGTVRIETGTLYARRMANEQEAAKPKL
jgi:hypothetical protein